MSRDKDLSHCKEQLKMEQGILILVALAVVLLFSGCNVHDLNDAADVLLITGVV